jgi:hypothetical protein
MYDKGVCMAKMGSGEWEPSILTLDATSVWYFLL